ncbi:MAG: aldo/keto reductase [Acidimicrobiales bacterium]
MSTASPAQPDQVRTLADGRTIPVLGLGVWQVRDGRQCVNAVRWALEAGYRHIDTAQAYGNEQSVGRALKDSGIPRADVFITTKFYPGSKDPAAEVTSSLKRLGVDYVDLYLIHWPQRGATWAWPGMERAQALGHARSIGVSNFSVAELDELAAVANVAPVVNQVQVSPFEYRRALIRQGRERGIVTEAYSPLGTGRHISNNIVGRIAERVGRTPAQVLLRWSVQHELVVLPKSTHRDRIEENAQIFDFVLSADDMAQLDALDHTDGTDRAHEDKWW